jgi:hypothetical protein
MKHWTLEEAIEQGYLLAFLRQEADRGITSDNAAEVEKALKILSDRAVTAKVERDADFFEQRDAPTAG